MYVRRKPPRKRPRRGVLRLAETEDIGRKRRYRGYASISLSIDFTEVLAMDREAAEKKMAKVCKKIAKFVGSNGDVQFKSDLDEIAEIDFND